ncbi:HlyD family efflux transporter periplasmic adaptor subunit [Butyrivibrio fibrisolvens]|uniref:HlyD family efflux transporter periplasmic adaptor subunit n=1 Tax=Butyrivibrio fibrisolvens TaxID=831 RepID=UPI0003B4EEEA|nr:HlyD family efflux transporter periplasmic adaptor subunit [Butyrivibrio fibrisolvens]
MAAKKKNSKITNINSGFTPDRIGILIFAVLLVYMIISIVQYIKAKHVVGYEVMEGSLSQNNTYTAIALRDEEVVENDTAGSVYYFATEDRRVAKGDLVYIVDEADSLSDMSSLTGDASAVSLTDKDYAEIKEDIEDFTSTFNKNNFSSVYDFKNSINGTLSKLVNTSYLNNIGELSSSTHNFIYRNAPSSGIVLYSKDGYEGLTLQDMKSDLFDQTTYEKTTFGSSEVVTADAPVYKLAKNEDWSVVIQVDDQETADYLMDQEYIKIKFLKNQVTVWGQVSTYTNSKGEIFVQFSFTNSMITFATDRFLSIELIIENETGLKIPNSSIIEKNFYVIPSELVMETAEGNTVVQRKTYLEDGSQSSEDVIVSIHSQVDDKYYIDQDAIASGDILMYPATGKEFTVSEVASLTGVYNINKGYADFKQIEVLYSNDEYSIVKSGTEYGLNVYDYIALDATSVTDDELIYD